MCWCNSCWKSLIYRACPAAPKYHPFFVPTSFLRLVREETQLEGILCGMCVFLTAVITLNPISQNIIYGRPQCSNHIQKNLPLLPFLLLMSASLHLFLPGEALKLETLCQDEEASLLNITPECSLRCNGSLRARLLWTTQSRLSGGWKVMGSLMNGSNFWGGNGLIAALSWLTWDLGLEKGGPDGTGNSGISNPGVQTAKWKYNP